MGEFVCQYSHQKLTFKFAAILLLMAYSLFAPWLSAVQAAPPSESAALSSASIPSIFKRFSASSSDPPVLKILESDETGVLLELSVPAYSLALGENGYRIELPPSTRGSLTAERVLTPGSVPFQVGVSTTARPGDPAVPVISVLVGLPPTGEVTVQVETGTDPVRASLPGPLEPVPTAIAPADPSPSQREYSLSEYSLQDPAPGTPSYFLNPEAYAAASPTPPAQAAVAEIAWLRDQRLARIELAPFQYIPASGSLLHSLTLRIRVNFSERVRSLENEEARVENSSGYSPLSTLDSRKLYSAPSAFENVLAASVVNYENARQWRTYPNPQTSEGFGGLRGTSLLGSRYEITVNQTGLYRLTYADLLAAGLPLETLDPRQLHLSSQGFPVAIYIEGETDGQFDPGDALYFYGERFFGDRLAEEYASEMLNPGQPGNNWLWLCASTCKLKGMFEKYTVNNVYWLFVADAQVASDPGTRMAFLDAAPAEAPLAPFYLKTVRAEQQKVWWSYEFNSEDTWLWDSIQVSTASLPVTHTHTTPLTDLSTAPYSATVRASIASFSSAEGAPDHHTVFSLNSYGIIDDHYWDGRERYTLETQVPHSALVSGTNSLYLKHAADINPAMVSVYMFFDWFEITYARQFVAEAGALDFIVPPEDARGLPSTFHSLSSDSYRYPLSGFPDDQVQVFDISDPLQPTRLLSPTIGAGNVELQASGVRFYAVSNTAIRTSAQLAAPITYYEPPDWAAGSAPDYVFIAHSDYVSGIQYLANYRAAQGLTTLVIDVADLYRQFNHGIYHPIAIRNFLAWCLEQWGAPPTYALLVGDGHFDFFGFSNTESPSTIKMPPNLAIVDPWQGETDGTNLLATIIGDDTLPDVMIARLTIANTTQLANYVNKVINYEAQPPQAWDNRMTFIADNVPDSAGDFLGSANDLIAAYVDPNPYFQANRLFQNDYNCPGTGCAAMITAVNNSFNNGSLLITFIGHGDVTRWSNEQILTIPSIGTLNNPNSLPIVLSMTCKDGWWSRTNRIDIASTLLNHPNGGAIAAFSPTGLGVGTGHDALASGFLDALVNDGTWVMGAAALNAKTFLYANGLHQDLMHTFITFGDPALQIHNPYGVDLALAGAAPAAYGGDTVQHTLVVTNTGLASDQYTLTVGEGEPAWGAEVSVPTLTPILAPGQAYTFTLSVTIPLNALEGASSLTTVTATSQHNAARSASVPVTTTAISRGLSAYTLLQQSGPPGATLVFTIPIYNTSAATSTITVTLHSGSWPWAFPAHPSTPISLGTFAPGTGAVLTATVELPPDTLGGQMDTAWVSFESAPHPNPQLPNYPITIDSDHSPLSTLDSPSASTTLQAWVTTPGLALSADPTEQSAPAGTLVTYTLQLTNTWVTTTSFTLARTYFPWPVSLPAQVGPIAPGASVSIPAVISISENALGLVSLPLDITISRQDDPSAKETIRLTTTALTGGLLLTPLTQTLSTPATEPVVYWVYLTNRLAFVDSYTITISGQAWETQANNGYSTLTYLGPGSTIGFRVIVTPPWYADGGETDTVTVTVTSGIDPAYTELVQITTVAIQTRHEVFLPVIRK